MFQKSFSELWLENNILDNIRNDTRIGILHKLCRESGSCPYLNESENPEWNSWFSKKENTFGYNDYPLMLELDLPNTHCNIGPGIPSEDNPACIMCARNIDGFVQDTFHNFRERCEKIKFFIPFLMNIHIQGYAEPFYKDIIFETLKWLDFNSHHQKTMISTITNGIYFNKKLSKRFDDLSEKTCVIFSIDAGTKDTYKKIRTANAYELVIKNLIEYGNNKSGGLHLLQINNNINMLNVKECVKMVEDAKKANVDTIQLGPTDPMPSTRSICINDSNRGLFIENFELARIRAEELGVSIRLLKGVT